MTNLISLSELARLPFVDQPPADGRRVLLSPFFDEASKEWHLYLEVRPGHLGRIAGGEPVHGSYLGRVVADATKDLEFPLATLVTQHLSFPKVLGRLPPIENDIHQCAVVLHKYSLLSSPDAGRRYTSYLISSELEYLLLLIRSLYDLIHLAVADIAKLLIALDGTSRPIARQLPDSFRAVAMNGGTLRSGDEIISKYALPPAIANWYVSEGPAFREIRKLRDGIAHHGRSVPTIFELPEGLALDVTAPIWADFAVWPTEHRIRGKFGSVRALFAALVLNAIGVTTRLANTIIEAVELPAAIGNNVRSFLRGPFVERLVDLPAIIGSPWERISSSSSCRPSNERKNGQSGCEDARSARSPT